MTTDRSPGPRDTRIAVLDAALAELWDNGYQVATVEAIARRAQVHKATIYRRWTGKPALVADALATRLQVGEAPDTGDPPSDFAAWLRVTIKNYSQGGLGNSMSTLMSDLAATPEGLAAFRASFLDARREGCRELLERAVAKRYLAADTDLDLFMDLAVGAIFYRIVITGGQVDADLAVQITTQLFHATPSITAPRSRA